jgi:hypothetical protein
MFIFRSFSTSEVWRKEEPPVEVDVDTPVKKGWFDKLLNVRTIAPSKESHAKSLSDKQNLYEVMCKFQHL